MAARICILDAHYAIEAVIGNISDEAIFEIMRIAQTLDLKCLSFIYIAGDSYFNIKQAVQIKKEIALLRNHGVFKHKDDLDSIEQAADTVLASTTKYLQFLGD